MNFRNLRLPRRNSAPAILRVERLDDRVMPSVGVELHGGMPLEAPGASPVLIQTHTLSALGGVLDSITRSSGEEIPQ
jgi:hypothetical protein